MFRKSIWTALGAILIIYLFRMSMYRNTIWLAKGLMEYTKGGYLSAAKNFVESDLEVVCSSKNYLITGSNSGLGKQTALEIAKRGGIVHLVCRNATSAEQAKNEIIKETSNENIHVHSLDLSNSKEVHTFSQKFSSDNSENGLHVLINNAGCMVNKRELTNDGLEKNFATNTLGTYILTESLIPLLKKSAALGGRPRVITVSSGGMLTNKLDPLDLQFENKQFDGTMAYAQNKRQQIIMTDEWAAKYSEIQFSSMHPGWADTPAVRTSMPGFYEKMKDKLRTVQQGADTVVWLAVTENSAAIDPNNSGAFYQDRLSVWKHLPLAWTSSDKTDIAILMKKLEEFYNLFKL